MIVLLAIGSGLLFIGFIGLLWQNSQLREEKRTLYERIEFMRHTARCDARTIAELQSRNNLQAIRLDSRNS